MYYLLHWPAFLNEFVNNKLVKNLISSFDRELIAIITETDVIIYHSKTFVKVLYYCRSQESLKHYGESVELIWKYDSTSIAIGTAKGFLLIISLQSDPNSRIQQTVLNRNENGVPFSTMWNGRQEIPALTGQLVDVIDFEHPITCVRSFREDLLITTKDGNIQRVKWNGGIMYNQNLHLRQISFYYDLEHSRASRVGEVGVFCRMIESCPSLGGLLVLLSNGRAALLNIPSTKLDISQVEGVWAEHLKHGTCMAANIRFRSVAFGGKSGEGVVYTVDDATGALRIQHRLKISSREYPDAGNVVGSVIQLQWSPDFSVLAMVWEKAGFSLWSVYGSLLFSTLGEKVGLGPKIVLSFAAWGPEGYSLWSLVRNKQDHEPLRSQLVVFNMAKSALTTNPIMHNHEHLLLQSSTTLYISEREEMANGRQWHVASMPSIYLNSNWPVRYTAVDSAGKNVVIAGKFGIAHYSLSTRRWKVFGNETQERGMQVVGGLAWWHTTICLGCNNLIDGRDEVRLYQSTSKLDNNFSHTVKMPCPVLLINIFRNTLTVLCADGHIILYRLQANSSKASNVILSKIQKVVIADFIPFPLCVVSLTLTSLRSEISIARQVHQSIEADSLLVNYAGRLMMFQRDLSSLQTADQAGLYQHNHSNQKEPSSDLVELTHLDSPLSFTAPFVVASSVEIMWTTWRDPPDKKYLTDSLWLNCGSQGMRVWLPLLSRDTRTPGFMSKRIMLPFEVDIYPLVVLFEEALLLGASNDFSLFNSSMFPSPNTGTLHEEEVNSSLPPTTCTMMPYAIVEKTSQIYLNHIVKQLLRKNLGVHALDLSLCCRDLPYFHHVLELLLHEVLEEEATSKEPIPDPLLPRVVAFIQEFPEFLDTVAHCARKTEVALWPYLFATVGNPRDLFDSCIRAGDLDTAASYLIILQNSEKPTFSKQHAAVLLENALNKCKWNLVKDLMRFLKTIGESHNHSTSPWILSNNSVTSLDPHDMMCGPAGFYPCSTSPGVAGPSSTTSGATVGGGGAASAGNTKSHAAPLLHQQKKRSNSSRILASSPPCPSTSHQAGLSNPVSPAGIPSHSSSSTGALGEASGPDVVERPAGPLKRGSVTQESSTINFVQTSGRRHHNSQPCHIATNSGGPPVATGGSNQGPNAGIGVSLGPASPSLFSFGDEVDALLNKHARKLLSTYQLMDLAKFAANTHFHNHQFINWLTKERHKSGQIEDYVAALKHLHTDFLWPLPIFIPRVPPPSSGVDPESLVNVLTSSGRNCSTERPQDHHDGDNVGGRNGRAAHLTLENLYLSSPRGEEPVTRPDEVFLKPTNGSRNHSLVPGGPRPLIRDPASEHPSECGSSSQQGSCDLEAVSLHSSISLTTPADREADQGYLHELQLMTQELANKGPEESQIQIRYLYHIFLEAGCREWCVLIGVLLRDPISIVTTMNRVHDNHILAAETARIARGLATLEEWAETNCLGYKGFLHAVRPHVGLGHTSGSSENSNPKIGHPHMDSRKTSLVENTRTRDMRLSLMLSDPDQHDSDYDGGVTHSAPTSAAFLPLAEEPEKDIKHNGPTRSRNSSRSHSLENFHPRTLSEATSSLRRSHVDKSVAMEIVTNPEAIPQDPESQLVVETSTESGSTCVVS